MSGASAFGWRTVLGGFSSGLDFLGLAGPIEGILDAETSGITNATFRVRYFSLVPWYYWMYTRLGGEGSAKDQRRFAVGFEMLIAYANIAWLEVTGSRMAGIIRRVYCERKWKEGKTNLPLRGGDVGDTPSPLDAALYGPSLRRLGLLGLFGQLHTCRDAGAAIAEEVNRTLGRIDGCAELAHATTVDRTTVERWAEPLSLGVLGCREAELLRAMLFACDEPASDGVPPRVYTLLLLLGLARTADMPFGAPEVELALAKGLDLRGKPFDPGSLLRAAYRSWRILSLLKALRRASELAFASVYSHVNASPHAFNSAEGAAEDLIARAFSKDSGARDLPQRYDRLVEVVEDAPAPAWEPPSNAAEDKLRHAVGQSAWCHAVLRTKSGQVLLADEMARVGSHSGAALASYYEDLESLLVRPTTSVARWLCVDRGVARHFQVAARKLGRHDTFRLIEDEEGVRASDKCPLPDIAIRVNSMLSLVADLGLLGQDGDGYLASDQTEAWYQQQLRRLE